MNHFIHDFWKSWKNVISVAVVVSVTVPITFQSRIILDGVRGMAPSATLIRGCEALHIKRQSSQKDGST